MYEKTLKIQIIKAMQQLNESGLNSDYSGNVSIRFQDIMLISPSGVIPQKLTLEMICKVDLINPEKRLHRKYIPSSEWRFHRDILNAKPNINAVVHTHAQFSTILSILRRPIPAIHYMIAIFGGKDIPVCNYACFGSQELSDEILKALKNRYGCLMANHGMVVTGRDINHALWLARELEILAHQFYHTEMLGGGHKLKDCAISDVNKALIRYAANQ